MICVSHKTNKFSLLLKWAWVVSGQSLKYILGTSWFRYSCLSKEGEQQILFLMTLVIIFFCQKIRPECFSFWSWKFCEFFNFSQMVLISLLVEEVWEQGITEDTILCVCEKEWNVFNKVGFAPRKNSTKDICKIKSILLLQNGPSPKKRSTIKHNQV